jgi:hypothetical protein
MLGLLLAWNAEAHPVALYWYAEPDGSSYRYEFRMEVVESFSGNVDGIVFADTGIGVPAGAEALADPVLVTPPAPYSTMGFSTGAHEGPIFENHPADGWMASGIGDDITWTVSASNAVDPDSMYWSNTRGDSPRAEFEPAIHDCRLASVTPPADRQGGECAGLLKVCDPTTLRFEDPDYDSLVTAFEDVELSCDTVDNDCNGTVDDVANPPLADLQDGVCAGVGKACEGGVYVEPDYAAVVATYEAEEASCDFLDNDCNGAVDDARSPLPADMTLGVCEGATRVCQAGTWVEPDYTVFDRYEAFEESCDGLDNDCNGETDERRQCVRYEQRCGCGLGGAAGGWAPILFVLLLSACKGRGSGDGEDTDGSDSASDTDTDGGDTDTDGGDTDTNEPCEFTIPPDATVQADDDSIVDDGYVLWVCRGTTLSFAGGYSTFYLDPGAELVLGYEPGNVVYMMQGAELRIFGEGVTVTCGDTGNVHDESDFGATVTECPGLFWDLSIAPSPGCP